MRRPAPRRSAATVAALAAVALLAAAITATPGASAGPISRLVARALDRSAAHKSGDILRCDSFSHEACGRAFTYWMARSGYFSSPCWRAGENIAWGTGPYATVHSIFDSWMHSPGHRENILGRYRQTGIALRVGGLEGNPGAHVWTQDFAALC